MKLVGTVRQSNPDLFAMQKVLFYLIGLGLCKGQVGNQRGQELTCYECAAKSSNDTCTDEYRKSVKILGFDKRCRIMEMNGKVVSQGVVPKVLCTQNALAKVSDPSWDVLNQKKITCNISMQFSNFCQKNLPFFTQLTSSEKNSALPTVMEMSEQIRPVDIS